jgi:peroxiredoxin
LGYQFLIKELNGLKKNIIVIIALLCLVAYGGYDYLSKSSERTEKSLGTTAENVEIGIEKGNAAPDFELSDLEGNPVKLSDFQGKVVMVNFWATWCPPCRIEMPHMQKFYEDYESKDVVILGVNLTPTEQNEEAIKPFVEEQKLTFPIVLDPAGEAMLTYQVVAYPTTYLLDSKGVIQEKFRGAINYEIMEDAVSKIR